MTQVNAPLVSAVIPVYNGEAFLAQAIDSVLKQTYPCVECIVVDDGSTDNSSAIADRFGSLVRYLRKENGGVARARNFGVSAARGEYVAFLDADDVWLPRMLDTVIGPLLGNPKLGLVCGGFYFVDEELNYIGEMMMPPNGRMALRNSLLLELPVMVMITAAALPVKVFQAIGGFDEQLSTSADTDLACRIASTYTVEGVNEPVALYRQHGSQMHLKPHVMEHDMLIILGKLFEGDGLPAEVQQLRNRAYANLNMLLAASYFKSGDRQKAVLRFLRALASHPFRVLSLLRKRLSSGSGELIAPEVLIGERK